MKIRVLIQLIDPFLGLIFYRPHWRGRCRCSLQFNAGTTESSCYGRCWYSLRDISAFDGFCQGSLQKVLWFGSSWALSSSTTIVLSSTSFCQWSKCVSCVFVWMYLWVFMSFILVPSSSYFCFLPCLLIYLNSTAVMRKYVCLCGFSINYLWCKEEEISTSNDI